MSLIINIDDLLDLTLAEVKNKIKANIKYPLNDLKFSDILQDKEDNRVINDGIHLIVNKSNQCIYIDKCLSSHFYHRFGFDFDIPQENIVNTFVNKLLKVKMSEHRNGGCKQEIDEILETCSYLVIRMNQNSNKFIKNLE